LGACANTKPVPFRSRTRFSLVNPRVHHRELHLRVLLVNLCITWPQELGTLRFRPHNHRRLMPGAWFELRS